MISCRPSRPSFCLMCSTWDSTVRREMNSRPAISGLPAPGRSAAEPAHPGEGFDHVDRLARHVTAVVGSEGEVEVGGDGRGRAPHALVELERLGNLAVAGG